MHLVIKGTLDEERTDLFVIKASAIRQMKGETLHQKTRQWILIGTKQGADEAQLLL
jgi:hypothetical protein